MKTQLEQNGSEANRGTMMQANTKYRRRTYFIEREFQARFILKFCILVVLGTLLTGLVLYLLSSRSTTVIFQNLRAEVKTTADFILPILIQTIIVVTIIVGTASIILTLFISHKIGGPLYRFKKEMQEIEAGNLNSDFRIRKTDQLRDIASGLNTMIESLRQAHLDLKKQWQILMNSWKEMIKKGVPEDKSRDIQQIDRIIEDVGRRLEYFKV